VIGLKTVRETINFIYCKTFNFVEGFVLSNNPQNILLNKAIGMSYKLLNQERITRELKRARALMLKHYKVKEGSLLRTEIEMNARTEISMKEYRPDWHKIPENSIVMFLGVEHDQNYDAITLKVLWDQKIFYIYKNANFNGFSTDFRDRFKVLL